MKSGVPDTISYDKGDLFCVIAIGLFVLAVFSFHIIGGASPFSPHLDMDTQFHLYRGFMRRVFASGQFPTWTSHIFCGMPFLGFSHTSALYPLTLLYLIGGFAGAHLWNSILHLFIYGAFYFLLFRALRWGRPASFLMAALLCFSGYYIRMLDSLPLIRSLAWAPGIMLFTVLLREKATLYRALALVAVTSMALLGGEVEILSHVFIFTAIAIVAGAWGGKSRAGGSLTWGLPMAAVILLTAAQLLPLAEYSAFSLRGKGVTYRYFTHGYNISAVAFVLKSAIWPVEKQAGILSIHYTGFLTLLLAMAGMGRIRRDGDVKLWLAMLIYSLLILGMASSPAGWILYHLPVINRFHNHVRVLYLFQLSWVLLAGCGLRYFIDGGGNKFFIYIMLAAIAHVILQLIFSPRPELWTMLIVGTAAIGAAMKMKWGMKHVYAAVALLLALDILPPALRALPKSDESIFTPSAEYAEFFNNRGGLHRTVNIGVLLNQQGIIPRQAGFLYGAQSIEGWISMPPYRISRLLGLMEPAAFGFEKGKLDFSNMVYKFKEGTFLNPRSFHLANLTGLKYISCVECNLKGLSAMTGPDGPLRLAHSDGFEIYENDSAMERAFIVHDWVVADGLEGALKILSDGNNFNPRETVILERNSVKSLENAPLPDSAALKSISGKVEIVNYGDDSLELRADLDAPGFIMLTDSYYPGWRAWDKGEEARILPADGAFRALYAGTGAHDIKMVYRPLSFRIGLWVSMASILSFMAMIMIARRGRDG